MPVIRYKLLIQEEDGSPTGRPITLKVSNGTLTDNGDNTFSLDTSAGSGATTALDNLASVAINTSLLSDTTNTDALGSAAKAWSDLFLGDGSVIDWNSDVALTHSANTLTFTGGTVALGTATATGGLTGNITGNASGTAATVTDAAQAAITTAANLPWTGLKAGTDGEVPTFDSSGNPAFVAVGTATHVLTSNGAGAAPTFQAASGGGNPSWISWHPPMSATAGWSATAVNGGTRTQAGQAGTRLDTSTNSGASEHVYLETPTGITTVMFGSATKTMFGCWFFENGAGAASTVWMGIGEVTVAGTGITFTPDQAGFKRIGVAGVFTASATNGNGTTETATAIAATANGGLSFVKDGTTDIKFYKNGSLVATHTTNLPNGSDGTYLGGMAVSNNSTTDNTAYTWHTWNMELRNV